MNLLSIQLQQGKTTLLPASDHDSPCETDQPLTWPKRYAIFGVNVSATTYAEVIDVLIKAAKHHRPTTVDFAPVSVLVEAAHNPVFRSRLNSFDLVCPDGQPVRWCLNHFQKAALRNTVCGTTATLRLCESAARHKIGVYLYGSTPETMRKLQANLLSRFPRLQIVGAESPPFSSLGPKEQDAVASRINDSGAGLVFVGIGSPNQENFVWEQKSRIRAVQLCVGAAFDFIAGTKKRAPHWMQDIGLEWVHRVCSEPGRLGKRYVLGNARFVALLLPELLRSDGYRMIQSIFRSSARRRPVATTETDIVSDRRPLQSFGTGGNRHTMPVKSHARRIVVIAPGPPSQGGISAVVGMHKNCTCWGLHRCVWVETMNGGGAAAKLVTALMAFGQAAFLLPQMRLMHIHMALGASLFRKFPFFVLAQIFNKTTVVHLHDFDSRFNGLMGGGPSLGRTLCALMLRRADRVVALSDSWEKTILRYVPAARTCCHPNPYWLPPDFRATNRTGHTVLYLNRIESRKGYEYLLRSIPAVLKQHPQTTFVFAGHGEIPSARQIAADLGVERAVEFPGWVEGDRKWRLLAEADILCLPTFAEGVPITMLEAMGAGVAVVTTPVGGIPDVVKNGENGLLVPPRDASSIAESLIRLLGDADLRARLSQAGRETVERMNSLPIIDRNLKSLYAELCGEELIHSSQVHPVTSTN